ncbi:hypothetical protein [Adhaeribacter aquaticus]|uniref:hypothetical protein n=1 Tax=Adhaeribacter aquaticus TaxID=299567 RepID=UPI0004255421|nr:hypothetical protein [Adhaeribacter aquaticus]
MKPPKSLNSLFFFSAFIFLFTTSCKENSEPAPEPSFTEDVAVEMTKQALTFERGGLLTHFDNSINILDRFLTPENCGAKKDTTLAKRYSGLTGSSSYDLKLNWNLTCVNKQPSKVNFSSSGASGFDGIMLASAGKTTSAFEVSGLEASSTEYFIKQAVQEGSYTSAFKDQPFIKGKTILNSTNIVMDKKTRKIKSGVVHLNIEIEQKKPSRYQGQVTFNGNNTATLMLNNGKSYTIRL